jgi:N-acetyl-1-D-myo-inositol-2-amino-2-deoxy-alpha-D-glucopyranoside deacetylase
MDHESIDGGQGRAPALLAIFAHPDDEQFGTAGALAGCAARGISVHVLSATRGGGGEIADPALATPETLAAVRSEELREACRLLGFADPILLDHPDGRLGEDDPDRLLGEIVEVLRRLRPRVVLTFDANGGYGHPDHMAIHRAALTAVQIAADPGDGDREDRRTPHRPDKLYVTAYPRTRLAEVNAGLLRQGLPPIDFGAVQTLRSEELGTPDERVTTAVPVDAYWDQRWAALRAHRTQYGPGHPFMTVPESMIRGWLATDSFVRLTPPPDPALPLPDEDDLWAGLPLPG